MASHRLCGGGFLVLVIGGVLLTGDIPWGKGDPGVSAQAATPSQSEPQEKQLPGMKLYRKNCQVCHGADGRGASAKKRMPTIPDFTSDAWQESRSDAVLFVAIMEGKGIGMPPYDDRLKEKDAREQVEVVRAFRKAPPNPQP
jgi:mono/diheme cytochrome c family protein